MKSCAKLSSRDTRLAPAPRSSHAPYRAFFKTPGTCYFNLILAIWAVFMLVVKFRLAHHGLSTGDLYNYANAPLQYELLG